jgi:hypothetical protein
MHIIWKGIAIVLVGSGIILSVAFGVLLPFNFIM